MAFDFIGMIVTVGILGTTAALIYKKKYNKPISELWKNTNAKVEEQLQTRDYQRVYITRGIKT